MKKTGGKKTDSGILVVILTEGKKNNEQWHIDCNFNEVNLPRPPSALNPI